MRLRIRDKDRGDGLLSVLLVGLFFAVGWEPQGTGLVWRYPGYIVYAFMDIPLALLLSWSWWMVVCRVVATGIERSLSTITGRRGWASSKGAVFLAGVLVALVIEPLSVSMGWWDYLVVGERAAIHFPLLDVSFNLWERRRRSNARVGLDAAVRHGLPHKRILELLGGLHPLRKRRRHGTGVDVPPFEDARVHVGDD